MSGRWGRAGPALGFAAILILAAWARLSNAPAVLSSGEMLPPDGDSAYHLLRILRTVERFPHVPTLDPEMNWPAGGACPWADGFDLAGAAFVRALGGARSPARARLLAGLYPVVLGLLVVWATMALARAVSPEPGREPVALAAGLLAALLPQAVAASRLARVDHHVLEALAMVLLARWALTRPPAGEAARRRLLFEVEGALLSAGAVYVFTGATVYVAMAAAVLLASILSGRGLPAFLGSGAPGLLGGGGLAGVLTLPAISGHGRLLSFAYPSLLQPALVAAAGTGLALAALAGRLLPRAGAAARAAATLAAGAAFVAAGAIAWPGLLAEVGRGIGGWLLHRDPWLSRVDEFQPLWSHRAYGGWAGLYDFFGVAGWLAPLGLALGGAEAVRAGRARGLGFTAMAAALFLLTLLQIRFGRVFAPFLAVAAALALAWVARIAAAASRRREASGGVALLAAIALAAADPRMRTRLAISARAAPDAIQAAALDLRDGARPLRGGGAGVATAWDLGHAVEAIAGRPVVANGFGSYLDAAGFEEMSRLGQGSEAELYELLDRRDLGFLVAGAATMPGTAGPGGAGVFEPGESGAVVLGRAYLREVPLAPLLLAGSGVPALGVRHLSRLLPRFASAQRVAGISFPLPVLWTYERVPGATLSGTAGPGAQVVAELPFREHGWPHVYRAWTSAGADGRWQLVVPVPTDFVRPTLWTGSRWQVRAGAGPAVPVAVPEGAVRAGERIAVGAPPRGALDR